MTESCDSSLARANLDALRVIACSSVRYNVMSELRDGQVRAEQDK
jgi:hypothetical protein